MRFNTILFLSSFIFFNSNLIYSQSREDLRRELLNVYRDIETQLEYEIDQLSQNINQILDEITLLKSNAKNLQSDSDSLTFINKNNIEILKKDIDSIIYIVSDRANNLRKMGSQLIEESDLLIKTVTKDIDKITHSIKELSILNDNIVSEKRNEAELLKKNANKLNKSLNKDLDISSLREHLNFIKDRIKELEEN